MHDITRGRLLELLDSEPATTHVSLFLALDPPGPVAPTQRLRLAHLLDQARVDVLALGRDREREVDALLEPARQLCAELDEVASDLRGHGVAVFLGHAEPMSFRVPLALRDQGVVGDRYHLKPLLPALHGRGRFHVLALSRKRARWIVADAEQAWELRPAGLPQGVDEVTRYDDPERTLQLHSGPRRGAHGGRHAGDAVFHGQGGVGTDDAKLVTQTYCRHVARALAPLLGGEDRPLVLAGERSLLASLRRELSDPRLVAEAIHGSPDRTPLADLHAQALPLVGPRLHQDRVRALRRYEAAGSLAVEGIERVLPVAQAGRVALLFVALDQEYWSPTPSPAQPRARHATWLPGDVDLLDLAAAETLRHGGEVHAVPTGQLPGQVAGLAAAVLRY